MFFSVIISTKKPVKKPVKKPIKHALKLILVILMLLAAFLANSTCSISNTLICLYTASVALKASTVNKYKKLSALSPLGLFKPGQPAKLIKVT
jgi:hypothetical protein